jgi:succinoglycan biosynthesis transport protein ExoP
MGNTTQQLLLPAPDSGNSIDRNQTPTNDRPIDYFAIQAADTGRGSDIEKGSVLEYWRLLGRSKAILLVLALIGVLGGVLVSLAQSPLYKARTTIEVQDLNHEFMNMKAMNPVDDSESSNGQPDLQTELQILQSETLIVHTLDRLGITSMSRLNPQSARWAWRTPAKVITDQNRLLETASGSLKVAVAGQTRILEVSYQSTDPKIASEFANTLVSEFIDQNVEARWQTSQRTSSWLTQQLDELRSNLQRSDDSLQAYARKEGLIYTGDKENVSTEKLRQLQTQVSQAQADRVLKEARFKIASSNSPDTLPDVLNDNALRTLKNSIVDLKRQEADLSITFKPDYSKARRLRAEIGELESAFETQRSQIVSRITNDYQEAVHREGLLATAYDKQVGLVMTDSQKSIQYDILKRDVDTNRQIYETMLQRVKESGIAAALKPANIRVIDPARVPEKPYKPNLPVNGAVGMLCGLMLGVVTAVTRERANRSLQQPGEASRFLGIPELGVIPKGACRNRSRATSALTIIPKGEQDALETIHPIVAWQDGATGLADSFRAVLASILFSHGKDGRGVLVITSAGPNEGKTTTATNLSVALARTGHKVLLIDGDIRKPGVHEMFGLTNTAGLTDLLTKPVLDVRAADTAIRESGIANLRVLLSGPPVSGGCDLLFSRSMPNVLAHYKHSYDMIIIDSPPLLHMPDARVLGRMADAAVLVARSGRTLREAAQAASQRLQQDRIPVLGIVLNDWNPKSSPNGFYGNYNKEVMKRYNTHVGKI